MGGWLYRGDATRRSHANNVYSALKQAGGIAYSGTHFAHDLRCPR
jgi:hypothetical protein